MVACLKIICPKTQWKASWILTIFPTCRWPLIGLPHVPDTLKWLNCVIQSEMSGGLGWLPLPWTIGTMVTLTSG